ncbi:MAG: HNH endonuclease [Pseudomonadota bacterium]
MSPLERLRVEKAASDCGFEMTPLEREDGLELRSAHFPEAVVVRSVGELLFEVESPAGLSLNAADANLPVNAHGYEELYELLRTAASRGRTLPNRVADAFRQATADMPRATEADRVVVARVGQTMFRAALLDYWQGRCCVTGLEVPELLRASHIKPWASCEQDDERLDVFNGLLLAPHLDAMFDAGWMTVALDGTIEVSAALSTRARETLGVGQPLKVHRIRPEHSPYLAFHHRHVYRRGP